jgi:hypothetical protein
VVPMSFTLLRERNEHEGETWHYWLQVDGNEEALRQLKSFVRVLATREQEEGHEPQYEFTDDVEDEFVVDTLVRYADGDPSCYMPSHQKVTGILELPPEWGEDGEDLYKGGVKRLYGHGR